MQLCSVRHSGGSQGRAAPSLGTLWRRSSPLLCSAGALGGRAHTRVAIITQGHLFVGLGAAPLAQGAQGTHRCAAVGSRWPLVLPSAAPCLPSAACGLGRVGHPSLGHGRSVYLYSPSIRGTVCPQCCRQSLPSPCCDSPAPSLLRAPPGYRHKAIVFSGALGGQPIFSRPEIRECL